VKHCKPLKCAAPAPENVAKKNTQEPP
jgi:hypothetical protein